jgi:hypothetical protein
LAAALSLLPACTDLVPWHEPAVRVYLSAPVRQCPATDSLCAVLTELPADAQLLAQLGAGTVEGRRQLARTTGMAWTEPRVRDDALHLEFPPPPMGQTRSVYVLEALRAETAVEMTLFGEIVRTLRCALRCARLVPRLHDLIPRPDGSYWLMSDEIRMLTLSTWGWTRRRTGHRNAGAACE